SPRSPSAPGCDASASCRGSRRRTCCPPRTAWRWQPLTPPPLSRRAPPPSRMGGEGGSGQSPETGEGKTRVKIAVPLLPHIANFDDLDPLRAEPGIELVFVRPGMPLPGDAALVILPGSKATLADLAFLRHQGWDIDLLAHHRHGGHILGLCGGYQMLGRHIADPEGREGPPGEAPGLGLLDIET